ncbi:MAG: segregation/condensation protein A [Halobacteriaceae archaeon]
MTEAGPDLPPAEATGDGEEVEPVELLVQLAEEGDIDPWDIDIVAVTDEFLAALDDGDLRTSGRALFYASVLLRMKSDAILEDDTAEEAPEEGDPWEDWDPGTGLGPGGAFPGEAPTAESDAGPGGFDPVAAMESEMERRLDRKRQRGTPETLSELVRELREVERGSWWKESRTYDTSGSPRGFQRGVQELDYHADDAGRADYEPTEQQVTGTAHAEDIEATIADVQAALDEQFGAGRAEVLFREIRDAGGSRVQTFLALLFLANRGAVRLQQDDLFGDLWVQDSAGARGSDEAVAD